MWNLINGYFGKEFKTYLQKYGEDKLHDRLSTGERAEIMTKLADSLQKSTTEVPEPSYERTEDNRGFNSYLKPIEGELHQAGVPTNNEETTGNKAAPFDEIWWTAYWKSNPLNSNTAANNNDVGNSCYVSQQSLADNESVDTCGAR